MINPAMILRNLLTLTRPALLAFPPEKAHELTLCTLEAGLFPAPRHKDSPALKQNIFGLDFNNPIGMAAGFDKNARVPDALVKGGFGFAEIGTVTPLPQSGNPSPRVFRLIKERALINRLGFNNEGHDKALNRLKKARHLGPIGVNIGANKTSRDRVGDYVLGLKTFYDVADYFAVNISSPNTPGLRDLQGPDSLNGLLARLMAARKELTEEGGEHRPLLVKLAPDIADEDVQPIADVILKHGVDGMIVSNTTLARDAVKQNNLSTEQGGLSGKPVFDRATRMLAKFHLATKGQLPMIGVGGVCSGRRALEKMQAGASLVQIYTGLIYEGPDLLDRIKDELTGYMEKEGLASLSDITGQTAQEWADKIL